MEIFIRIFTAVFAWREMMRTNLKRLIFIYIVTIIITIFVFWVAIWTGGIKVDVMQLLKGLFVEYDKDVAIIFQLRFPRIIVALLGGALMSLSGVCMQAVMKNPLADPGIIGISSGAAFGAVIVTCFFPSLAVWTPVFSFMGGMAAFVIVYSLAWNHEISPVRLILTGVAVDAFFTGLYQAFDSFLGSSYNGAASIINANISLKTWEHVKILMGYTLVSLVLCIFAASKCNLLLLSDKTVTSLGINVNKIRFAISILSVFMAAAFTALVGEVGFLGLIVPHIARLLVGSDYKKLLPYSALLGAMVFLIADTVGRSVAYPYEISPAIIMSIIGGPVLAVLLRRSKNVYGT